jgi:hypothetical protein
MLFFIKVPVVVHERSKSKNKKANTMILFITIHPNYWPFTSLTLDLPFANFCLHPLWNDEEILIA